MIITKSNLFTRLFIIAILTTALPMAALGLERLKTATPKASIAVLACAATWAAWNWWYSPKFMAKEITPKEQFENCWDEKAQKVDTSAIAICISSSIVDHDAQTVLHWAIEHANFKLVQEILALDKKNKLINMQNAAGMTSIMLAVAHLNDIGLSSDNLIDIIELLLKNDDIDLNIKCCDNLDIKGVYFQDRSKDKGNLNSFVDQIQSYEIKKYIEKIIQECKNRRNLDKVGCVDETGTQT